MTTWIEKITKPSPTNDPPAQSEMMRNDLMVAALVLFAMFLGFGIRNQVYNASESVSLGEGLPSMAYPASWRPSGSDDFRFRAIDPGSPSTFNAQLEVTARPLRTDESLEAARGDRAIKAALALPGYRELAAEEMVVLQGRPAIVSTYAFIADPTHDSGAQGLPVVVEAQDILFVDQGQFVVVSVASDAAEWDDEQHDFEIIFNSLGLRPKPEPTATPVATPPSTPFEGTAPDETGGSFRSNEQGGSQSEGGN